LIREVLEDDEGVLLRVISLGEFDDIEKLEIDIIFFGKFLKAFGINSNFLFIHECRKRDPIVADCHIEFFFDLVSNLFLEDGVGIGTILLDIEIVVVLWDVKAKGLILFGEFFVESYHVNYTALELYI
jgi:hypothetical protein